MTREEIINWISDVIELKRLEAEVERRGNDKLRLCTLNTNVVQVYIGIEKLAEVCGKILRIEERQSSNFPHEYSFTYLGVKFFQLTEIKESQEAGTSGDSETKK